MYTYCVYTNLTNKETLGELRFASLYPQTPPINVEHGIIKEPYFKNVIIGEQQVFLIESEIRKIKNIQSLKKLTQLNLSKNYNI